LIFEILRKKKLSEFSNLPNDFSVWLFFKEFVVELSFQAHAPEAVHACYEAAAGWSMRGSRRRVRDFLVTVTCAAVRLILGNCPAMPAAFIAHKAKAKYM
jgi:hypothetical protein